MSDPSLPAPPAVPARRGRRARAAAHDPPAQPAPPPAADPGDDLVAGDGPDDAPVLEAELVEPSDTELLEGPGNELLSTDEPGTALVPVSERGVVLYDPLRRYLQEIRNFHPLSAEEEHALAVRYKESGDRDAAYRLTTAHLRLVVRIAFDFKRSWLNLLDLVQEGNLGLLLALQKFDPYRGIRLSTYAAWWIRAYIIKFLLDNWRMVRVGTTNARRKLLFNLRKEKERLEAVGIEPHPKLLAERLDVSEQDVIEVDRSLGVQDTSLEAPVAGDSERSLGDTLAAPGTPVDVQVEESERAEILRAKLAEFERSLGPRERTVYRQRLLAEDPVTLQVLGERYGMTREGLRQVEKRIVRDLKAFLRREIKDFRALDLKPPEDDEGAPPRSPADQARKPQARSKASAGTVTKRPRKGSQA